MPGTAQEQKIMQEATIKHVEIDVNNNSWEILMQTYNGIPDELLAKASSYISQKCNIPTVIFLSRYCGLATRSSPPLVYHCSKCS